ncbi:unnamed protein product [Xylocopa violacea]|uniref:Uncharacterized protein n=1 Tax=Xylocopa violacea TaxID=135666 RepID=A0ABP1N2Z0_XYLVO
MCIDVVSETEMTRRRVNSSGESDRNSVTSRYLFSEIDWFSLYINLEEANLLIQFYARLSGNSLFVRLFIHVHREKEKQGIYIYKKTVFEKEIKGKRAKNIFILLSYIRRCSKKLVNGKVVFFFFFFFFFVDIKGINVPSILQSIIFFQQFGDRFRVTRG